MWDRAGPTRRRFHRRKAPGLLLAVALLVLLLLPTAVTARTTVTTFTASRDLVLHRGAPAAGPASLLTHTLVKIPAALNPGTAGTQRVGARGAAGTTHALPRCAVGTCTD